MQRMILVPVDQYDRMIESYDKAMEELYELREQLEAVKVREDPLLTVLNDEFRMSDSMLKYAKNSEVVTIKLLCRRIRERMECPDGVAHELELYDLMDEQGRDRDTAELLRQDLKEVEDDDED